MKLGRLAGFANLIIAGALLLAAWVLVTLLASRPALKHLFDLTPQARATVSPVTRELLAQLRQEELKLEFHLFFQPVYRGSPPADVFDRAEWQILDTLQTLTRDLLRQYVYLGGDAVRVRDYNLDTEMQESYLAAQRFSVTSTNTVVVVLSGRHKKLSLQLDLGDIDDPNLAAAALPTRRSVRTLRDFRGEQALSSAIKSLLVSGRPVVYFLSGYGTQARLDGSTGGGYSVLSDQLQREGFEVQQWPLREKASIPDDATALALLEPVQDLTERDADLLVAWLEKGGRLFVNYAWFSVPDYNTDGGHLGRRLGFELGRDLVFQKVQGLNGQRLAGSDQVRNLDCRYNPRHPITGPLAAANRRLNLTLGREFSRRAEVPPGVRLDTLVVTEPDAWLARSRPGPTGIPVFDYTAPQLAGALAPRDVGIVVDIDGENGVTGHAVLLAGLAINNVGMPVNGDLALGIFNWMADRKVLVKVGGDRYQARQLQIGQDQLANIRWLLIAGVPGLFLLLGILVSWRRSRWQ